MCKDCGCGLPGDEPVRVGGVQRGHGHRHRHADGLEHEHEPGLHHDHDHPHDHTHSHEEDESHPRKEAGARRVVEVRKAILEKNERQAERNRGFFQAKGLLVLNVLSSPGSGKTTFLCETVRLLTGSLKAAVVVGDLATENDAERFRTAGAPAIQITTGTVCHLEAEMVARALSELNLEGANLLVIENVGNLVCPASYDLGENLRVVLFSVTEGEDKPLKYPPIFQAADVVVLSKTDLAGACGYNRELALENIRKAAPGAQVFEVSARTGHGMAGWTEYLVEQQRAGSSRGLT